MFVPNDKPNYIGLSGIPFLKASPSRFNDFDLSDVIHFDNTYHDCLSPILLPNYFLSFDIVRQSFNTFQDKLAIIAQVIH